MINTHRIERKYFWMCLCWTIKQKTKPLNNEGMKCTTAHTHTQNYKMNATPADEIRSLNALRVIVGARVLYFFFPSHLLFFSGSVAFNFLLRMFEIITYLCNCMAIPLFFPMDSNSNMHFVTDID